MVRDSVPTLFGDKEDAYGNDNVDHMEEFSSLRTRDQEWVDKVIRTECERWMEALRSTNYVVVWSDEVLHTTVVGCTCAFLWSRVLKRKRV